MQDKNLNDLLKWGIENSARGEAAPANGTGTVPNPVDPEIMAALFGGPSDAELMKAAMEVICDQDPSTTLENRLVAFDNFEQLIESLDNANNMGKLALWTPLLSLLEHSEQELRRYAAWCVGTAVQNNEPSQESLLAMGGLPRLVKVAVQEDETETVRRKAIYALSSAVRNYQPAMDVVAEELVKHGHHEEGRKVDAQDMEAVDEVINALREKVMAA